VAHAGLIGPGQFKEQLQNRHHQCMPLRQRHGGQWRVLRRAACQAECQQRLAIGVERRQPQVVMMLEHRQGFTAVQLHGELG